MKVYTLLENESVSKEFKAAHGLSLLVKTKNHKILFDVGPNNYYLKNAKKMGVSLEDVDMIFISHGHNDHGTGIDKFLKLNKKAVVYVSENAFYEHVKKKNGDHVNIGIKKPKQTDRIRYISENLIIDDELEVIANIPFKQNIISDPALMTYESGKYTPDSFNHEIYLVIHEHQNHVLLSGCSHKGIEHIIDTIEQSSNMTLTHIIGGYHFSHYDPFNFKETDYLKQLSSRFSARKKSTFYSCHCTGDEAFFELKIQMKDQLKRIKTGDIINI